MNDIPYSTTKIPTTAQAKAARQAAKNARFMKANSKGSVITSSICFQDRAFSQAGSALTTLWAGVLGRFSGLILVIVVLVCVCLTVQMNH